MEINEQYKDTAFYYAIDVVEGNVKACQKVIKACQRHLDDLKNISNSNFEFDYFPEKAQNTIDFLSCQMLKQAKLIRWLDFKNSSSPAYMAGERKKTILSDDFAKLWFRLLVRTEKPF